MSTVDEKAKQEQKDFPIDPKAENNEKSFGFVLLSFILGLVMSLIVGWVIFPRVLYSQKEQPVDFNHARHMEVVKNGCQSCHFFRSDGSFSGTPKLAQCVTCHYEMIGVSAKEEKFFNDYVVKKKEVPWLIYSEQPDCVFFSHAAHVKGAKMDCVTCHGHIGESKSLKTYEQNRISGYSRDIWGKNIAGIKQNSWDRMKMDDCAACHKEAGGHDSSVQTGKDACFVCHK